MSINEQIEQYINEVTPIINSFNFNQEFDYENLQSSIETYNTIQNNGINLLNRIQQEIVPIDNSRSLGIQHVQDDTRVRLGEAHTRLINIINNNDEIITHLNQKNEEMGTKVSVEEEDSMEQVVSAEYSDNSSDEDMSAESDDNVQHIFMFVCHAEEYNPTGERNLYPFENNAYESVGIFSTYGETAYVPMLNQKLMHTLNIHNVLDCDTMAPSEDYNKRFLTVNPLAMQFRFDDVNDPLLGPYMGLFYLKVKEIKKNNIKVIEMKHLIRFKNTAQIAHRNKNEMDDNWSEPKTVHQIEQYNEQSINSEFIDRVDFGWDVVLNVISRFYKNFLNDSNGNPQIHMNEPVHIRLFCCREEKEKVKGKGKGRYGGRSLTDQTLFNVNNVAIAQPDDTNMRYFLMTNEKVSYFINKIFKFNDFIRNFLSQKSIHCENKILIVYLLMLLDNDISNINLLLERLCTIFLDTEDITPLSLLVMLSCNKKIYDMYKSRDIDITQYLSYSYNNEQIKNYVTNHIVSNIFSDCQKLNYDEGLKIYFMGNINNNVLPYVLFIILKNQEKIVVSLNWINQGYQHEYETHEYHPHEIVYGINVVLEKFNNIEIIYNNNIQGKGGMNKEGSKYKKKLDNKSMDDILNEMKPNRPLKLSSNYGNPYETEIKDHVSSKDIKWMKEFDKRQPTGIFSLEQPVDSPQDDSQMTEGEAISQEPIQQQSSSNPYMSPPRTKIKTDTEETPVVHPNNKRRSVQTLYNDTDSATTSAAASPERKKKSRRVDSPVGGKKKGKNTKREKKTKKARKTKKKRSNKK